MEPSSDADWCIKGPENNVAATEVVRDGGNAGCPDRGDVGDSAGIWRGYWRPAVSPGRSAPHRRSAPGRRRTGTRIGPVVDRYCLSCHNSRTRTAGLALDTIAGQALSDHTEVWERVVRKLRARQMPPATARRPDEGAYAAAIASLETALDRHAAAAPDPGALRDVQAAQPHRISQRGQGPAGPRRRCRGSAAERFVELRVRQHHRRESLAHVAGAVRRGGREDQPPRGRAPRPRARRHHGSHPAGPDAGRTPARHAHRDPRRRPAVAYLPGGRRTTRSASGSPATGTSTSRASASRTTCICCSTASWWATSPCARRSRWWSRR